MSFISFKDVSFSYESNQVKTGGLRINRLMNLRVKKNITHTFKNCSIELHDGDVLALRGSSGSGKTTFMRLIIGSLKPNTGTVEVSGSVMSLLENNVIEHKSTGIQNILLNGYRIGLSGKQVETFKNNIITSFDNSKQLNQPFYLLPAEIKMNLHKYIHLNKNHSTDICLVDLPSITQDDNVVQQLINKSKITVLSTNRIRIIKKFCNKELDLDK